MLTTLSTLSTKIEISELKNSYLISYVSKSVDKLLFIFPGIGGSFALR